MRSFNFSVIAQAMKRGVPTPDFTVKPDPTGPSTRFNSLYPSGWKANKDRVIKALPAVSLPAKSSNIMTGGWHDTAYDTECRRITQISDYPFNSGSEPPVTFARHDYSRRHTFNADDSVMLVNVSNGGWYLVDATTLQVIPGGRTGAPNINGIVGMGGACEPFWHPTNPKKLWHTTTDGDMVWYEYDIDTKVNTVLFDLTTKVRAAGGIWATCNRLTTKGEGRPSDDGRYWAFMCIASVGGDFNYFGAITYDRQTDTILGRILLEGSAGIDHLSMSPLGDRVVLSWPGAASNLPLSQSLEEEAARPVSKCCGVRAYTLDFNSFTQLSVLGEHSDLGWDHLGRQIFAWISFHGGFEGVNDGTVSWCLLDDPSQRWSHPYSPFPVESGIGHGVHISGRATKKRPGLFVLSRYSGVGTNPHDGGVHVAEMIPGGEIYRVAFNRSTASPYEAEPQASPNSDLTQIVWADDWSGTTQVIMCAVLLPSYAFPPVGSSGAATLTAPQVTGTATPGERLTRSSGTYSGVPTPSVAGYWETSSNAGSTWDSLTGETGTQSPVIGATLGIGYRWNEEASNTWGSSGRNISNVVFVAALSAPSNTVAPAVASSGYTDTAQTATPGTWNGNPVPNFAYQWQRLISSTWTDVAGKNTATQTPDTVGSWRCAVTGSNTQGSSTAFSNTMTVTLRPVEPVPNTTVTFTQANGTALSALIPLVAGVGATRYSVNGQELRDNGNGYATSEVALFSEVTGSDQAIEAVIAAGKFPTGNEIYYLYANATSSTTGYEVRITPSHVQLYLNGSTYIDGAAHGLTVSNTEIRVKVTTFQGRVRVYLQGSTTPFLDSVQSIINTGNVGVRVYASGNVANAGLKSVAYYKP